MVQSQAPVLAELPDKVVKEPLSMVRPRPSQFSDGTEAIDEAKDAVLQAINSGDVLSSDWNSRMAQALVRPSENQNVKKVLKRHGWTGTQFQSPPDRVTLLHDLDGLSKDLEHTANDSTAILSDDFLPPLRQAALSRAPLALDRFRALPEGPAASQQAAATAPLTRRASAEPEAAAASSQGSQQHQDAASRRCERPSATSTSAALAETQAAIAAPLPPSPSPFDGDTADIQRVPEYASEIFDQLFREESLFLPRPNYMESQTDINSRMRTILVDWLVEVHMKYHLRNETLFLTVNLIDRYLTRMHVLRTRLQLVGVVAMFIAAKFEEIDPPRISEFVYITDNAYSKDDILIMECTMLTALDFQIVTPTASHFLERLQRANRCDEVQKEVSQYLLELSLLEMSMIHYTPSHMVAAALLLSSELIGRRPAWPSQMAAHARAAEGSIRGCADEMRALLEAAPSNALQAVRRKFSSSQHHGVARMTFATAQ